MGRWRPPREKSSPYITPRGYARLSRELDALWEKRKEVVTALSAAAAEGDRSENAEYIYRKKQLREMDSRIRYLQKRLPDLTVVDQVGDPHSVRFSATVTIEREDGSQATYRLVGSDEINTQGRDISIDSPMARAMLGKRADDEFEVELGGEQTRFYIAEIHYNG